MRPRAEDNSSSRRRVLAINLARIPSTITIVLEVLEHFDILVYTHNLHQVLVPNGMVTLSEVEASNANASKTLPVGLVAVFAGATSGIGEASLKSFAKHTVRPSIYFIGRSQESGDKILKELKGINADGEYNFIKADMSLLKNVDDVCRDIKKKERVINLLFLSQGTLKMGVSKFIYRSRWFLQLTKLQRHNGRITINHRRLTLCSHTSHRQPPSSHPTSPIPPTGNLSHVGNIRRRSIPRRSRRSQYPPQRRQEPSRYDHDPHPPSPRPSSPQRHIHSQLSRVD